MEGFSMQTKKQERSLSNAQTLQRDLFLLIALKMCLQN